MRRFLILVLSLPILPATLFAQGRGMSRGIAPATAHPGMIRPAVASPHDAARSLQSAATPRSYGNPAISGIRYVRTRTGVLAARPLLRQPGSLRSASGNGALQSDGVPGLGFDFPHFAATHPQGAHGRDHERNRGFAGGFFPLFGGGYFMPIYPDESDSQQAPSAEPQQLEAEQSRPARTTEENQRLETPQTLASVPQFIPPQDPDEYVFVRRDGTLFFAAAFAWENGSLRYITREGLRHTLRLDQLDLNATVKFNEQRGLNFRLPA